MNSVPFGGLGIDDAIALRSMLPNCLTNTVIVFKTHTTYNISLVSVYQLLAIILKSCISARPLTLATCLM